MWRRIVLILLFLLFLSIQVTGYTELHYLFYAAPFFFLGIFYLYILDDRFAAKLATVLSFSLILFAGIRMRETDFVILALLLTLAVTGISLYVKFWNQKLDEVEDRKAAAHKEKQTLEERYRTRRESLKHLEERVNGLIHLFEIARDFNECLDFSELLSVLDQKIVPEFSFTRGTLILVDVLIKSEKRAGRCFDFGMKKREDKALTEQFAQECVLSLVPEDRPAKLELTVKEGNTRFGDYDTKAPLWLFPLLAERRLTAILAIEGGSVNDYQKFEVLASQLALQVKKIRLYEAVKESSIMDGLTKVFVRRHFFERFQEELNRASRYRFPLSVLMVDVDHFKSYNDKFGHLVGDRTLREVAQVVRDNVRRVDVIGRYGGEEFIVAAPEIKKSEALELAERIRSAVARKSLRLFDEETHITVSIGLSSFPEDIAKDALTQSSEDYVHMLIQLADKALYRAKEEGRNRVVAYDG